MADRINVGLRRVPAWIIYVVGPLPALWYFWLAASGQLGVDPVNTFERKLGELTLQLLIATLAVTPIRRYLGVNLLKFRRALGLTVFLYVVLHFLAWIVLDMGLLIAQALGDIAKRPYVTVGMAALLMLAPLAITSNNWSVRRLGAARWRRLHQLAYFAAIAGGVHYLWLFRSKSFPLEPVIYLTIIFLLLVLRLLPRRVSRAVA